MSSGRVVADVDIVHGGDPEHRGIIPGGRLIDIRATASFARRCRGGCQRRWTEEKEDLRSGGSSTSTGPVGPLATATATAKELGETDLPSLMGGP